jgi:ribosomal protein S7
MKTKFLNKIFNKGKKQKAETNLLKCLKTIQRSYKSKCSKEIFKLSIKNSSPFFHLRTLKSKGRKGSIDIPYLLTENMRVFYGIKHILAAANSDKKEKFYLRLNSEIIKSSNLKGISVTNKKKLQESAFLKRKFARFRWF